MRFFYNCSKDQKQQVLLLVATCETVFSLNSSRAKSTRPPLTYREVLEQAKLQVAAAGLPEATLFLGNCYSGPYFYTLWVVVNYAFLIHDTGSKKGATETKDKEVSELKQKVAELEKLLKNNSKPANNSNNLNNSNNNRKPAMTPLQRKLANTCR